MKRIKSHILIHILAFLTPPLCILTLFLLLSPPSSYATPYPLRLIPTLTDQGTFDDLNPQVRYSLPSWLSPQDLKLYRRTQSILGLYHQKHALHYFQLHQNTLSSQDQETLSSLFPQIDFSYPQSIQNLPLRSLKAVRHTDRDRDGVEDGLDLYLGTRKVDLNSAQYRGGYERIKYPKGEIARDHGVCTDVIIRAFRNAGWDLQKLLYLDMKRSPKSYGLKEGKNPNRHIDHRRVRRLIIYFKRHYHSLPITFKKTQTGKETWLPGDLVFMDTFGVGYPTHVGLVSGRLGHDGEPMITNNWTDGYSTQEMSLRNAATYTHRFRITLPK